MNLTVRFETEEQAKIYAKHFPVKAQQTGYCILLTNLRNNEKTIYLQIIKLVQHLHKLNLTVTQF